MTKPTTKQIKAKADKQEPKNHDMIAENIPRAFERGARWAARFKARRIR